MLYTYRFVSLCTLTKSYRILYILRILRTVALVSLILYLYVRSVNRSVSTHWTKKGVSDFYEIKK